MGIEVVVGISKRNSNGASPFQVDPSVQVVYRQEGNKAVIAGYQDSRIWDNDSGNKVMQVTPVPESEQRTIAFYLDAKGVEADSYEFLG